MKCHCSHTEGKASFTSSLTCCFAFIAASLCVPRIAFAAALRRSRCGCCPSPGRTSDAVIDILHADDVVFPEIGARLDLDQIERNLAGVLQAMHASQRHEDRLVLAQQDFLV